MQLISGPGKNVTSAMDMSCNLPPENNMFIPDILLGHKSIKHSRGTVPDRRKELDGLPRRLPSSFRKNLFSFYSRNHLRS